jgi:hypothetical protein
MNAAWDGRCERCGTLLGLFLNVAVPVDGERFKPGLFCSRECGRKGKR